MSVVRQLKPKPAKRPTPRMVTVSGEGDFATWTVTARADFPAAWLLELQSGDLSRIVAVLDRIILTHNFPTVDDTLAERMEDVDPYDGLLKMASAVFEALGTLPNR